MGVGMSGDRPTDEDKVQHTEALGLCVRINAMQSSLNSLYHELVLHYAAGGVPSQKTANQIKSVEREYERLEEQMSVVRAELDELDR